jgi:phosphoribosylanthranilate isomerase
VTEAHRIFAFAKRTIQIAGVLDEDEARMLVDCGADLLGLPLDAVHGKAEISGETAGRIVRAVRTPAHGVLITYLSLADGILSRCRDIGVSIVQLHGSVPIEELVRLRRAASHLVVVRTLVVRGGNLSELVDEVDRLSPHVDAFLTDTFDPLTGLWGATGKTHDWSVSRRLVERSIRPVILAGGLNPENVHRAILDVGPAGVDVHTGVEEEGGRKDRRLVQKFIEESRRAFEAA